MPRQQANVGSSTGILNLFVQSGVNERQLHVVLYDVCDDNQFCCRLDADEPTRSVIRLDVIYRCLCFKVEDIAEYLESKTGWYLFLEHHKPEAVIDALERASLDQKGHTLETLGINYNCMEGVDTVHLGTSLNFCTGLKKLSINWCYLDITECPLIANLARYPPSVGCSSPSP